jgi:hypothetical protein
VETYIFNSDKVTAIFEPWLAARAASPEPALRA